MKIYVSGASAEADAIAQYMSRLRAGGIEITLDWVAGLKANIAEGKTDALLTNEERAQYAEADLDAIAQADVFWLLAPENPSTGSWVELGYALSCQDGLSIFVSGPGRTRCIFVACADGQFQSHEEACQFILAAAEDL